MRTNLIEKAQLSEKAYKDMANGVYTFIVADFAKKEQVAKAVEKQFAVKVKKVNIAKIAPKTKRIGRGRKTTLVGGAKKAIVYLAKGHQIAMFATKKDQKSKKAGEQSIKEKDDQVTKAEGKEG